MSPPPLRLHQRRALDALEEVWAARRARAWVVLPPGAGKTRVGTETIARRLASGAITHAVVLSPNTAIQGQWAAAAAAQGLEVGDSRDLATTVTTLTYQSVAVFDPDSEADPGVDAGADPGADPAADADDQPGAAAEPSLLDRLHRNGRALVDRMDSIPRLLIVLDECHHLLEVWGRLLAEVLERVPDALVLGLTATPPEALSGDQAELVAELFGEAAFTAGVPAVVREGDLAPYAELAWLTTPTVHEEEWLAGEAVRFAELTTDLTSPDFGSVPFLQWLDARFVTPVPRVRTWAEVTRAEPAAAAAALRMHHAGLLALPAGARPAEAHRRPPTVEDWVLLLDDWLDRHVTLTDDERDHQVLEAVRRALPAVGHVLTRRGIRRGRSAVDRVLARSESKTTAVVEIASAEAVTLGERTRVLVVCDHERASATVSTRLLDVIDPQAGSATAVLAALAADPTTRALSPMLVTGSTVAGTREVLEALVDHVGRSDLALAAALVITEDGPVARVTGPWTSRRWVGAITELFEAGRCQVLVGTRGLLGEGWDARRVSTLVDLSTATTTTAVVQTRGRALRTDPAWPEKVAVTWSVVCVSEEHPKGGNDWDRLVRKHTGFHGVDEDGDIVDGVAHVDAGFSPYAPPPVADFAEVNRRMRERSTRRDLVRASWRVGEPYRDLVVPTLRVLAREVPPTAAAPAPEYPTGELELLMAAADGGAGPDRVRPEDRVVRLWPRPPEVRLGPDGLDPGPHRPPRLVGVREATTTLLAATAASGWLAQPSVGAIAAVLAAGGAAATLGHRTRVLNRWAGGVLAQVAGPPSLERVSCALADALHAAGLAGVGAEAVVVEVHPGGEHRLRLEDPTGAGAATFTEALDELLAPVGTPRYLIGHHVLAAPAGPDERPVGRARRGASALRRLRRTPPSGQVWHQVPTVLGTNGERARTLADAWGRWVGGTTLLFTGSPEGAGILAASQGADPFAVTTVVRRHWT
ncbi:DEAD/DEAH box helicase [Nocardioides pantholopis]|uniref:DEAD/DEAH box helicase n=1 Tax=Nocardioides pantholopis TaxID=2483798 RepID=UPI0021E10A44|nr:DEAD/DEAH box helicase family protein [Nocardioides pantholopis]